MCNKNMKKKNRPEPTNILEEFDPNTLRIALMNLSTVLLLGGSFVICMIALFFGH